MYFISSLFVAFSVAVVVYGFAQAAGIPWLTKVKLGDRCDMTLYAFLGTLVLLSMWSK